VHRLVIALVTLLGLTAGSVVAGYLLLLSGSPDRLAAISPARTAAYVSVYLNPSVGQQLNLEELIGRLPGFADESSLDAKVDQIIGNLLSGTGIDYETEVKPWLGDQLAVASWPLADGGTELAAVVMMAVKDPAAAEDAMASLFDEAPAGVGTEPYRGVVVHVADGTAYAFVDEALVIGSSAGEMHPIIDAAAGGAALADRSVFRAAMSRVPPDHLAAAFVDVAALAGGPASDDEASLPHAMSMALTAETDGLRLTGSMPVETVGDGSDAGPSLVADWIPSNALAAAVLFDLPQALEAAEAALGGTAGSEALGLLDTVRALAAFGLGLDVDADILPLLDGESGIAITAFGTGLPHGQLILRPDDPSVAPAQVARIVDRLVAIGAEATTESRAGVEITSLAVPDVGDVAYAIVDGTVLIGFSADDVVDAIGAHAGAGAGALSASDGYRSSLELAGGGGGSRVYLDFGALVELGALDTIGLELPGDARDILSRLGAIGVVLPPRTDSIEFNAAITVPDRAAE
jgi:hypothetical protein